MDELEAMLGKPDWKPSDEKWEMPKGIKTPADALVMTLLKATCRCGEKFMVPNSRTMLRFGNNLLGIKQDMWRVEYNDLPKEVEEVETKVLTCPRCFADASFVSTDFNKRN